MPQNCTRGFCPKAVYRSNIFAVKVLTMVLTSVRRSGIEFVSFITYSCAADQGKKHNKRSYDRNNTSSKLQRRGHEVIFKTL